MDKNLLRRQFKAIRGAIPPSAREELSLAACQRVMKHPLWNEAHVILVYAPLPEELDLWPLIHAAWDQGKEVVFPRCREHPRRLDLYRVSSRSELQVGAWGIEEPDPARCPQCDLQDVELALIPVVAMDDAGYRLGNGGGYYDRLMPQLKKTLLIGFDEQRILSLLREPHDAQAQGWVSPSQIVIRGEQYEKDVDIRP